VVVDDADRLQPGIDDGRSDELEAISGSFPARAQRLTKGIPPDRSGWFRWR